MTDIAFQVRLDAETHRRWRVKAAELGYTSLSHLVRAAVEAHPYGGTPAEQVASISASFVGPPPPRDIDPAECPKRVSHRKGVFCKHCGATP